MIVPIVILALALLLIWKGSDWLTDSLVPVAQKIGTSYIAVTTLIVAFALSIPEIFTSVYAHLLGHPGVGLGVIIGSVMANIGLTVGLSAMLRPLRIEKAVVLRDGVFMIIVATIILLLATDLKYTRTEGIVLLLLFIPYAINVWAFEKWRPKKSQKTRVARIKRKLNLVGNLPFLKFKPSLITFFIGALLLVGGSYLFSSSLITLNETLKIPDLLLGITLGALGPALPNIAAALQATRKGFDDAALTETFGANIFTLLITLGLMITLAPITLTSRVFSFDLTWMIIIHALMLAFIIKGYHYKEESLTRYEGLILVLFYLTLIVINVLS